MSGTGSGDMRAMVFSNRRSLETIMAFARLPIDEAEDLLEIVSKGIISEECAIESVLAQEPVCLGVY